jgi:hypothetical protein
LLIGHLAYSLNSFGWVSSCDLEQAALAECQRWQCVAEREAVEQKALGSTRAIGYYSAAKEAAGGAPSRVGLLFLGRDGKHGA